jgi:hypothetical protein
MREGDHYPSGVYLPAASMGICRNVQRCENGLYPPYEVVLGDGWCMDCYDKKVGGNNPPPTLKPRGRRRATTAFPYTH